MARLWWKRLQRRFSPRRIRLGSEANANLDGGEGSALACIVGRELCLFTTLDAARIPEKQRDTFVSLAIKRAAPFSDPDFGVAWTGAHHAAVWYWSRARARDALGSQGGAGKRISYAPEPLFVGAPVGDATELLGLVHGVEARAWKQGRLVSSKWWETPPGPQDWQAFLRSAGFACDANTLPPAVLEAPIASQSWARAARASRRPAAGAVGNLDAYLPRALLALGALATLVYAFQIGSIVRNHADAWGAHAASGNLDAPLQRILDARESADRNRAEIESLLALRRGRPQVMLMAEAARLLPASNWELRRWSQPAPGRIEVTLVLPQADPEKLVADWEQSPLFEQVTTDLQPRSNLLTVRANVTPAFPEAAQ